jgi:hypothetical protein
MTVDLGMPKWHGESPMHLSYSQLKTFKQCRRKWWLSSLRGLYKINDDKFGPLQLGTKIHKALELHYVEGTDPVTFLKDTYTEEDTQIEWQDAGMRAEFFKEMYLAVKMIEGFMEWKEVEGIDAGMTLVSAEQHVEYFIEDYNAVIHGYLDQIWHRDADGALLFRDWKTAKDFSAEKFLINDEQTKIYQMILKLLNDQRVDGAQYMILKKSQRTARAQPPFYKMIEARHNVNELRAIFLQMRRVIEEMIVIRQALLSGTVQHQYLVYPNFTKDCSWHCPFYDMCAMFDDGSNVEGMLSEYFTTNPDKEEDNVLYRGK